MSQLPGGQKLPRKLEKQQREAWRPDGRHSIWIFMSTLLDLPDTAPEQERLSLTGLRFDSSSYAVFGSLFFLHNDAVHRTLLLKTVAAVPDMHATLNRHFNALVKPGDNHKWERLVLDEAENKHRNAESPCALDEAIKQ